MENHHKYYLGVDVGSITTKTAVIDENLQLIQSVYIRTEGRPIQSIQNAIKFTRELLGSDLPISGTGATGSARLLTGIILGADVVRNEITAHSLAALHEHPEIQTIIEIGGQDSKIIIIRNGIAIDFAMNTVCAAGTGSFLDTQARRLQIPIEQFGEIAVSSKNPISIAGRCTVFAESDMIHKQALGVPLPDIANGLCYALVRNYLNNVGKGKDIIAPIIFQGGVAANIGIREAFEHALHSPIIVPKHYGVMGAIGAAILAYEEMDQKSIPSKFNGWDIPEMKFTTSGFECKDCPNVCEIIEIFKSDTLIARWGSKCGKWDSLHKLSPESIEKQSTFENPQEKPEQICQNGNTT